MNVRQDIYHQKTLPLSIEQDIFQLKTRSLAEIDINKNIWTLRAWFYRCRLVVSTLVVCWLLFVIQKALSPEPSVVSIWQSITSWAEVVWIIPAPVATIFWLGWFLFAQAVRSDPNPIRVPSIVIDPSDSLASRRARLVFRFVTRGDNVDILRASVQAVHDAFAHYPLYSGPYRVEVVSECPVNLVGVTQGRTFVYAIPKSYMTANQSRFKARALTYLQEQVRPDPEDWHIYLDEESKIDAVFIAGIYQFIMQSEQKMRRPKQRCRGYIGQGTIIYQGGHWFFRAADAIRTADDQGRFHLQYRLGVPIFGMHGSFIVVRGTDEAHLSFDVGTRNSIAEDTAWALRAWATGFRFAWIDGYLYCLCLSQLWRYLHALTHFCGCKFQRTLPGLFSFYRMCKEHTLRCCARPNSSPTKSHPSSILWEHVCSRIFSL